MQWPSSDCKTISVDHTKLDDVQCNNEHEIIGLGGGRMQECMHIKGEMDDLGHNHMRLPPSYCKTTSVGH